jgi:GrpB-like predicted nucleotidyltransferase (UPF0157 family)
MSGPARRTWQARPVELSEPDPAWAATFEREAARMRTALGRDVRIEHVGSTSVPGLAAKPVVYVQVSVPSLGRWEDFGPALERLGYRFRGDQDPEHLFFSLDRDGVRLVNVHVCPSGSGWERRHLAFRDRLRACPEEAAAYLDLERLAAARVGDDVLAYTAVKTPIVRRIERRTFGGDPPLWGPDPEGPDVDDPLAVVPYDRTWPERFRAEAARVRSDHRDRDERRVRVLGDYLEARPEQADRVGRVQVLLAEFLRNERLAYVRAMDEYLWVIEQRMAEEGFPVEAPVISAISAISAVSAVEAGEGGP